LNFLAVSIAAVTDPNARALVARPITEHGAALERSPGRTSMPLRNEFEGLARK
jgi:hypothetical protein